MPKSKETARKTAKGKAAQANVKGAQQTAFTALVPIAKEINVRWGKASELDQKAQDHRLAAALQLVEAEKTCKKAKVAFKEWCNDNLVITHETARKLLPIGKAKDPEAAMADQRAKNATNNKNARKRAKAPAPEPAQAPSKPAQSPTKPQGNQATTDRAAQAPAYQRAADHMVALPDHEQVPALEVAANALDRRVITSDQLKAYQQAERLASQAKTADGIIALFKTCHGQQDHIMTVLSQWMQDRDSKPEIDGDGMAIPDFLKRSAGTKTGKPVRPSKAKKK